MLRADLVIRTNHRPLEETPRSFDAIGVNVTAHPFLFGMVDRLVGSTRVLDTYISGILMGDVTVCVRTGGFQYEPMQSLFSGLLSLLNFQANIAAPLKSAENHCLIVQIAAANVAPFTADIRFVDLNDTSQQSRLGFIHRLADAMAKIPCCLIAHLDRALQLVGANTFLRLAHQIYSHEPLGQRQMRIVEDCTGGNRELVTASIAIELLAIFDPRNLLAIAARALNAIRPAQGFEKRTALFIRIEVLEQLHQIHRLSSCHG